MTETRTIELKLQGFSPVPSALIDAGTGKPVESILVPVKELFHHYYIVKYGDDGQDTGVYEYERRLAPRTSDWRYTGSGIGADAESKRGPSNELGKAFARWFLATYLDFAYFAPLEWLLDEVPADGGPHWKRITDGDTPDYVCGVDEHDRNLLEAKGRYASVSFATAAFREFRRQIDRVALVDATGRQIAVKGYVSAVRWATEKRPTIRPRLNVEDPWSPGEEPPPDWQAPWLGKRMIAAHYAPIFARLQLPLYARGLRRGEVVDSAYRTRRGVWECKDGPLRGRVFVGGIIPGDGSGASADWPQRLRRYWETFRIGWRSAFLLQSPDVLFGVESKVFTEIVQLARSATPTAVEVTRSALPDGSDDQVTLLRDGSVVGNAELFEPIDVVEV